MLDGTVRTFNPEVRRQIPELLERIAAGIASGYGATADLSWYSGIPSVTNDARVVDMVLQAAEALHLPITEAKPSAGGEDFAHYQEQVAGCFIWMGTGGTEEWHHPKFTLNEDALVPSVALFAFTAIKVLEKLNQEEK